jgi:hypothetical protein
MMVVFPLPYQIPVIAFLSSILILVRTYCQQGCFQFELFMNRWKFVLFLLNILGLLTTNLLSMGILHIGELTFIVDLFIYDLIYREMLLSARAHHVLGIIGLCFQMHIGVGGAAMSYLFTDEVTDYFTNPILFWIVFYNVICGIAVLQGIRACADSPPIKVWVTLIVFWWIFSFGYHITKWNEISSCFFGGQYESTFELESQLSSPVYQNAIVAHDMF